MSEGTLDKENADPGSGPGFEPSFPDAEAPQSREQELELALAEAQDKYVRTLAETENFKKRVARERVEERAFAAQEVVQSFLPVVDNLERALAAAKAAADPSPDSPLSQLEKGVDLVLRQFEDALKRQGVVAVEAPLGKAFDPNLHQPLVQEPDPAHEEGVVLEVLQKGWRLGDRLLRPAMVKVAART
ncbi:MAG TPA: nucleotide exchange factor GrpE [bacterium]|jgi:molecular chaperone GrpE|nr:nucleotide exchange factor GrpE [bacterium]